MSDSAAGGEGVRAVPFYCPYCGETDIRPGQSHGAWYCQVCDRRWSLRYQGLGPDT